jgi:hypothetical protein
MEHDTIHLKPKAIQSLTKCMCVYVCMYVSLHVCVCVCAPASMSPKVFVYVTCVDKFNVSQFVTQY